jgi:hypothetical protein
LSKHVIGAFGGEPAIDRAVAIPAGDPLADDDFQLALYLCYELHYAGFDGVDSRLEWDPNLIALRCRIEEIFLAGVEAEVARRPDVVVDEVPDTLFELARQESAVSLSRYLGRAGTVEQYREFMVHRSAYQLKEADPHSWAIPRLTGAPKVALLEIQYDEYGSGRAERMHSALFAESMRVVGLDARYGAYLDAIPGSTLATVNLMSMFGLHRRWRGAIVGHLAMFEITSAEPNRRLANGLRRLGLQSAAPFFDEHVEADSVHENLAAHDLAGGLAKQDPGLASDIVFGAEALLALDARWENAVSKAWKAGRTSLLAGIFDRPLAA